MSGARSTTTACSAVWAMIHTERAALDEELAGLEDAQWAHPSLCGRWRVEEVVAHLSAAASVGRVRWLASVLSARFDFDVHNARRLAEHRGATPAPVVTGSTLHLVMAMAGRRAYAEELSGPGAAVLLERCPPT